VGNMKKVFILFSIMVLIIILSVGIVDGLLKLTNDINNHLWISLVGRWESRENGYYEIEFNSDGTFNEYYYGVKKGSGDYQVYGNSIVLNYDASSCRRETGNSCRVYMKLIFEIKTIILENLESKKYFDKVSGQ
jgi:hypothetical protein